MASELKEIGDELVVEHRFKINGDLRVKGNLFVNGRQRVCAAKLCEQIVNKNDDDTGLVNWLDTRVRNLEDRIEELRDSVITLTTCLNGFNQPHQHSKEPPL
jgi:hypothetical protein